MDNKNEIFIEAESFSEKGGWVVESQSMRVIHSSYLIAHGMGEPVNNAFSYFDVEAEGYYYVWALTRDWTAVWDIKESAGIFNIAIDGGVLGNVLGNNSKEWSWQLAGRVFLSEGSHRIELCDRTGFNGRCDAIYLSDSADTPGSDIIEIDKMRERLNYKAVAEYPKDYELIVVGGGIAGICTALSAAKSGVSTLLINDRPVLGGCNSSEIRVCLGGQIKHPPYDKIGDVVKLISPIMGSFDKYNKELYEDDRKLFAFELLNSDVLLNECVTEIEKDENKISAIISTNTITGKKTRIKAKMFSDCSGDGILAYLGGATLMYGKEGKAEFGELLAPDSHMNVVMGHSIRWYAEECNDESSFPALDWNLNFNEDNYLNTTNGDWEQETGFRRDMVNDIEYIRDYGLRAIYANWSFQKNACICKDKFAKYKLSWVSALGGKRESVRVLGDYVLTENDIEAKTEYDDGTACISWGIDIHLPETVNEREFGEAFRSFAYHRSMPKLCQVPYRCLYSKEIDNLFIGGRLISATHIAFSAARVMRTLGMLGEVAGLASAICKKYNCSPRTVYTDHLEELKELMKAGVYLPDAFAWNGVGDTEKYHFKDIEWWYIDKGTTSKEDITPEELEKFKACVKEWQIPHKYQMPKEWM